MRRGRRRFSEQQKVIVKQTGTDNQSLKQKPASRPTVGEHLKSRCNHPSMTEAIAVGAKPEPLIVGGGNSTFGGSQSDDAALQPNRNRMRPIIRVQFGKDIRDVALDRRFADIEAVCDLFVGISGSDQQQHVNFP